MVLKCIHAVSNFIGLIPFRSIRQMGVNFPGFKLEKSVPNIRRGKSRCLVYTCPIKLKLRRFPLSSCCEYADNEILC